MWHTTHNIGRHIRQEEVEEEEFEDKLIEEAGKQGILGRWSMWHLKGFLICVSHGYWSHSWQGDPLSWVLLQCLPKCYIRLASWSQSSQGYLAPSYLDASCEDSLWFMRILGKGNQGSHWSQECLRAQCLDCLWTTSLTSQVVLYLHLS